ncbi:MAG TPA: TolC family protein [Verrucomicrobiae bacterium]|nr:TolC family protein [Verrucomicrobiae bacterium]
MSSNSKAHTDETKLVRLYMELTGMGESAARSVFMHVCAREPDERPTAAPALVLQAVPEVQPEQPRQVQLRRVPAITGLLLAACLSLFSWSLQAQSTNEPDGNLSSVRTNASPAVPSQSLMHDLTLVDAVDFALHQNADVLRAQKAVQAAQGIAIQTRAVALPTVGINGDYAAVQRTDVDIFQAPGFTFGTPQNWSSQIKLVQSLYEGGRMLSALRAARLTRQQSFLRYQTVLADTVLAVQVTFYDVLLAEQQIKVEEASVELLTRELTDTTRRYDAGTVPRFNVLRAEVEVANARPKLISARNNFRIAKNNLANLLGLKLPGQPGDEIPLSVAGKLEAEPFDIPLPRAVTLALQQRTELGALSKAEALRKEDLLTARAGYKPSIQGYVGYDVHNSVLSQDLSYVDRGWIGGAQLTWNLFDGFRTQGRIVEATANYERAGVDLDDMARRIELDVRTAYSNFIEAREVLDTQKKVQEEADEALRLARARYEAGTGTQLDVLSAQTALTEARTTQIQALHDYAAARARLERAVGMNVPRQPAG